MITFDVDLRALTDYQRKLEKNPTALVENFKRRAGTVRDALSHYTRTEIEAAGASVSLVMKPYSNPLIEACTSSFQDHLPLIISPDDIWLTITQAFATHVEKNAEKLRKHFVHHTGKETIIHINDYTKGDPNTDWTKSFSFFSQEIARRIGKTRDLLVSNFSTTGPIEKAASEIVLMSTMKEYFSYVEMTMCGIPRITLLGTREDWVSVRDRTAMLAEFESPWTEKVISAVNHFIDAFDGNHEKAVWEKFFKWHSGSGGSSISGWINDLFPYVRRRQYNKDWSFTETIVPNDRDYLDTAGYISGLSVAPFIWDYYGTQYNMEFLGGFVGTTQAEDDFSVRPVIGWAVRDVTKQAVTSK